MSSEQPDELGNPREPNVPPPEDPSENAEPQFPLRSADELRAELKRENPALTDQELEAFGL